MENLTTKQILFRIFMEIEGLKTLMKTNTHPETLEMTGANSFESKIIELGKPVIFAKDGDKWTAQFLKGGISEKKNTPSEALDSLTTH